MWREILALLASLSADPVQIETETPRAAAAVSVARASMARPGPAPTPQPDDADDTCCSDCRGTGRIVQPDGHVTDCPCPTTCDCKRGRDPQLVPVPQLETGRPGRIECDAGVCYWVDDENGQRYRITGMSSASPARPTRSQR